LQKNWLRVQYDPDKVAPETMLETVAQQKFQGTIVPDKG